jgi:hypothetical protein
MNSETVLAFLFRPGINLQPQRELRRWVASIGALLALIGLTAVLVNSGDFEGLQFSGMTDLAVSPSPASIEAVAVKNAAVASSVRNSRLMALIGQAQSDQPISVQRIQAVKDLSNHDIVELIHNAESQFAANVHSAAAQLTADPALPISPPVVHQSAAPVPIAVTSQNVGKLDVKSLASAFEAHLEHEESVVKALLSKELSSSQAAHTARSPAPAADLISTMTAQLDHAEKADEEKMNAHFAQERQQALNLFGEHIGSVTPTAAVHAAVASSASRPLEAASRAGAAPQLRHTRKSSANLRMVEHLVFGHADRANDAQ